MSSQVFIRCIIESFSLGTTHFGSWTYILWCLLFHINQAIYILNKDFLCNLQVSTLHVKFFQSEGDYYISDLGSKNGTWLNGNKMKKQERQRVCPGDEISIGEKNVSKLTYKVKQVHNSVWDQLIKMDPNADHQEEKKQQREAVPA